MLATVTGLQGGAHNGLGKGFGGLLGGITIETTKSTHKAFWLFGVVCAGISVVYISIISIITFKNRKNVGGLKEANRRIKRNSDEEMEKENYEKAEEPNVVKNREEVENFFRGIVYKTQQYKNSKNRFHWTRAIWAVFWKRAKFRFFSLTKQQNITQQSSALNSAS